MAIERREEMRENWGTRTGFVLAAVGSAVGLGNLWGFPYKLYSYGGGAFLVPYVVALVVVGIPMMILEFSLGHATQRAAPDAFGRAHRRFEAVGWWGIVLGFVIITYYPVILAYCCSFLWYSVKGMAAGGALPWAGTGMAGVNNAKEFFFGTYLGFEDSFRLGAVQLHLLIPLLVTWLLMYLCICRGVKLVGKVVWFTVPIPWIMLLILTVRGLTLPGSTQGLAFYLDPDWSQLLKPSTWRFAFGQVFFSLSLAFGVMITYASFLHRESDLNNNAAIISLADLGTSFVAGLAVFATLGAMSYTTQLAGNPVPVREVVAGGPGLAFVAFPYALAQLPFSAWFSFIFFFALLTLGIDSAFSITESVLASIVDKTGWRRAVVLPLMSLIGLSLGLVYITRGGGLNWLGTIDGFINGTWGIAFMGLLECLVLGWLYRIEILRRHANERSDWQLGPWWDWLIRVLIPIVLAALVSWNLFDDLSSRNGFLLTPDGTVILPNLVGCIVVVLAPVLAFLVSLARSPRVTADEAGALTVRRGGGRPALLLAVVALGLAVGGFVAVLLNARGEYESGWDSNWLLVPAVLLGIAALVHSSRAVSQGNRDGVDASWHTRWAGLLSTLTVGVAIGASLALRTMALPAAAPASTTAAAGADISGAAYVLLALICLLMVTGLGWCFYRALNASDTGEAREPA